MKATLYLEALKLIEQKEFDIILLDVMMPSMDGWDTCYQIRQISNVPIIMLTARNQNYDMVKVSRWAQMIILQNHLMSMY